MNSFHFFAPTDYEFGLKVEMSAGEKAKRYGAHNVLLVYGNNSAIQSGLINRVSLSLQKTGLSFQLLSGIKPNPTDDRVREGIALCHTNNIDFILAVGGGSVIDTCKAIAVGYYYEGDFWDIYTKKVTPQKALPIGVILTIAASGSEGSNSSVITKNEGNHKIGINYDIIRPKFALLNPETTFTLPRFQTACGITDIMAHIMERYFSNTPFCELTDGLAESALRTIITQGLIVMYDKQNYDARANLMWAGTLAHNGTFGVGREEDWASHRLEHELSAHYGVAHGAGLAVIFPAYLTFAAKKNPRKIAQYAVEVWNISNRSSYFATATDGIARLRAYLKSIGMPITMSELLNGKEADIELLVSSLNANLGDTIGNFVPLNMDDCRQIYQIAQQQQ